MAGIGLDLESMTGDRGPLDWIRYGAAAEDEDKSYGGAICGETPNPGPLSALIAFASRNAVTTIDWRL